LKIEYNHRIGIEVLFHNLVDFCDLLTEYLSEVTQHEMAYSGEC